MTRLNYLAVQLWLGAMLLEVAVVGWFAGISYTVNQAFAVYYSLLACLAMYFGTLLGMHSGPTFLFILVMLYFVDQRETDGSSDIFLNEFYDCYLQQPSETQRLLWELHSNCIDTVNYHSVTAIVPELAGVNHTNHVGQLCLTAVIIPAAYKYVLASLWLARVVVLLVRLFIFLSHVISILLSV